MLLERLQASSLWPGEGEIFFAGCIRANHFASGYFSVSDWSRSIAHICDWTKDLHLLRSNACMPEAWVKWFPVHGEILYTPARRSVTVHNILTQFVAASDPTSSHAQSSSRNLDDDLSKPQHEATFTPASRISCNPCVSLLSQICIHRQNV